MTTQAYEQFIAESIKGLPREALAEITDFVLFVRRKLLQPQEYEEEVRDALIRAELKQLSRDEDAHLEKEFEGYEQLYPRE